MNLDAPRPFVSLDGEVEIEKRTRSTFPIQYPLCGWSSAKAISGLLLWIAMEHIRHGEEFCNNTQSAAMAILSSDSGHKVCKKT